MDPLREHGLEGFTAVRGTGGWRRLDNARREKKKFTPYVLTKKPVSLGKNWLPYVSRATGLKKRARESRARSERDCPTWRGKRRKKVLQRGNGKKTWE